MPRADDFAIRHIGSNADQIKTMLDAIKVDSLQTLIEETVPKSILSKHPFSLPNALNENRLNKVSRVIAGENTAAISMIGMGYHGTVTPPVIRRNVMENPDWYTAYTPYQPEVSQGRLEILLTFQQMIMDLTGMELANASLLDEATAAAEAMMMARRVSKHRSNTILVDNDTLPQTIAVIQTRAEPMGLSVEIGDASELAQSGDYFAALLQYPGLSGEIKDHSDTILTLKKNDTMIIMASDPLSLVLLKSPASLGADIAVGSTQRFGVPMGYGGPHAAYFATYEKYKRSVPGRIIGVSRDADGRIAYRMALQTREQHIRRDKATSNICTSQVLLAVMATVYAMYHGPEGLKRIAKMVNRLTRALADELRTLGYKIKHQQYFDTIIVETPNKAQTLLVRAEQVGYNLRFVDDNHLAISLDETIDEQKLIGLLQVFGQSSSSAVNTDLLNRDLAKSIPEEWLRSEPILSHDNFSRFRSETEFMRYLRRTANKDVTLARSMIPLGSCTMKLNAAMEMEPISNPLFAHIHPFAPLSHAKGYMRIIQELDSMLCELTGFSAFSFQPNAGSQGEYAGLLCIRAYHLSRGDKQRNVCLIPSSAHGTNPASAVMAGMTVVVVKCDHEGNIDLADFKTKAEAHSEQLAATMITYPSTHGVFEEDIKTLCDIVHEHGGQVYMDGANMNAMVGICRPCDIGADVMHLNLHKTFAIPHGGGGPGVGPIGVAIQLKPFLPDHPVISCSADSQTSCGTISAAPYGSPLILNISWAYLRLLGLHGLKRSTQVAILNANYMAERLNPFFPVVYRGKNQRVAHECIIDFSIIKERTGVTVEDIAKRLVDYGFHAPTMSWPVPDSMMIEPTESESLTEIDRFCDAMISIYHEIEEIAEGKISLQDSVLRHAPHCYLKLVDDNWQSKYSRRQAFFPNDFVRDNKYWPPVSRVDNVFGDKNLVCSCPDISEYET